MNLEEDIKIVSVISQYKEHEYFYVDLGDFNTEQEAIEKKQQIIQWQKKAEKYDRLVKRIKENVGECDCEYGGCRHSFAEELSSLMEEE